MKAITAVCATGASVPAIINGRVSRHRDGENAEIQMYLSKLKDLVPFMPKNRKLSKLEIIQHVIDYICDLQKELETHPAVNSFDAAAVLDVETQNQQMENLPSSVALLAASNTVSSSPACQRQPLSDRPSPNTILSSTHSSPLTTPAEANLHSNSSHSHTVSFKGLRIFRAVDYDLGDFGVSFCFY